MAQKMIASWKATLAATAATGRREHAIYDLFTLVVHPSTKEALRGIGDVDGFNHDEQIAAEKDEELIGILLNSIECGAILRKDAQLVDQGKNTYPSEYAHAYATFHEKIRTLAIKDCETQYEKYKLMAAVLDGDDYDHGQLAWGERLQILKDLDKDNYWGDVAELARDIQSSTEFLYTPPTDVIGADPWDEDFS